MSGIGHSNNASTTQICQCMEKIKSQKLLHSHYANVWLTHARIDNQTTTLQ